MKKIIPKVEEHMSAMPMSMGMKKEKSNPIYPTFRIDLVHLPEAKDWKLGDEAMIEMKVKLTSLSQSRFDNSAEFEIHEIDHETLKAESKEVKEPK